MHTLLILLIIYVIGCVISFYLNEEKYLPLTFWWPLELFTIIIMLMSIILCNFMFRESKHS